MQLLVATTNENKLHEIRPVLAGLPLEILPLAAIPAGPGFRRVEPWPGGSGFSRPQIAEPEESGTSYWENARLKALAYASAVAGQHTAGDASMLVVAEDSGLEVAGLGGAPGVHSARFMGRDVPYRTRFAEIFHRLANLPPSARDARFVTALAVVRGREIVFETEATIDGVITTRPEGEHGFGYDPIFYYPPLQKTTAQLTLDEKCMVSHRARAFRDFARWLRHAKLT